ncbi:MAG: hypothetical protein ACRENE_33405 [Polyangiaceae bacterium]
MVKRLFAGLVFGLPLLSFELGGCGTSSGSSTPGGQGGSDAGVLPDARIAAVAGTFRRSGREFVGLRHGYGGLQAFDRAGGPLVAGKDTWSASRASSNCATCPFRSSSTR